MSKIAISFTWVIKDAAVKANKEEIIEAIKIGVIAGGSITYPNARFAFEILRELKVLPKNNL